jgi:hypothetical protein
LHRVGRNTEDVHIPKGLRVRRLHKAFLRYHDAHNWPMLRAALKRMGREDLIGSGPGKLVPAYQPHGTGARAEGQRKPGSHMRTQHTGLPVTPREGNGARGAGTRGKGSIKPRATHAPGKPRRRP